MAWDEYKVDASAKRNIGRYELVRRLGRGSQGTVYLGIDPNLERPVAIKLLTPDGDLCVALENNSDILEGRIASKLRHPNIISIYDAGNHHGIPYLVFEYVPGQTMAEFLDSSGPLSIEYACTIIRPLIDAIALAHVEGITHLDLSPRNVMVDRDGVPRVMDFGLSRFSSHIPTEGGNAVGTLRYMSPEHITGKMLGPYTDVFALASTFYEMVAGHPAINGSTTHEIMRKLREDTVDLSSFHELQHGEIFARFLKGAFEKDYRARFCDGNALNSAFRRFLKDAGLDEQTTATGTDKHSTVEFLLRRMRRNQDFPTMSRTLLDINRMTSGRNSASADQLANVILRDYALTSKLLKLVNSAYYSGIGGEVSNISQAIVILGQKQLRMTASGLTYTGQMKGAGPELKDSITKSFLSGLIARHLAQRCGLLDPEEAFICGLFQNVGENLVIFYFPEEYAEICELRRSAATDVHAASQAVLGIGYEELGAAVARTWQLPASIVESIMAANCDVGGGTAQLGHVAVFANDLCSIVEIAEPAARGAALQFLAGRFRDCLGVSEEHALELLSAGMRKLREHAPLFEISINQSSYCAAVTSWVNDHEALQSGA